MNNRKLIETAITEIRQIRADLQRDLADLAEINHGLVAWFQRGKELQGEMHTVNQTVYASLKRYSEIQAALIERLQQDKDAADWWKQ